MTYADDVRGRPGPDGRPRRPLPPPSPLAGPPPDPRLLTEAELTRVARVRLQYSWYRDHPARDDAAFLLRLLDRITVPTIEEVNRGTSPVSKAPLPVPGGGAPRAAPAAAPPPGEPRVAVRPPPAAGVAPDEAAAVLGELDALRAQLGVLTDDLAPTGDLVANALLRHAASDLDGVVARLADVAEDATYRQRRADDAPGRGAP